MDSDKAVDVLNKFLATIDQFEPIARISDRSQHGHEVWRLIAEEFQSQLAIVKAIVGTASPEHLPEVSRHPEAYGS